MIKMPADLQGYERALAAEPSLRPIVAVVDALCAFVRPDDRMCAGCVWGRIVKPLTTPLIGWSRGYPPEDAPDVRPDSWEPVNLEAVLAKLDQRPEPTTDTERWMRSSEAFDAFTDVLLAKLDAADPANGHGVAHG